MAPDRVLETNGRGDGGRGRGVFFAKNGVVRPASLRHDMGFLVAGNCGLLGYRFVFPKSIAKGSSGKVVAFFTAQLHRESGQ